MNFATIQAVFSSTRRVPFRPFDGEILLTYLQIADRNELDIRVEVRDSDELKEMFAEGAILLSSTTLRHRFLFLNIDAGRGFFGGQKSRVLSYIGDLYRDEFQPGPSFNNLATATSSINNLFRAEGALKGSAR